MDNLRSFAIVTGASSGIGFELARCCAEHGFDLLIAADDHAIDVAAARLRECGGSVEALTVDLATPGGVERLVDATRGRPVDALLANAGHGLGHAFLDQDFDKVCHVINTNVTGTLDLIQRVGRGMRLRRAGRILITGSIAGYMPGAFQAVYNGTKSFIDSFAHALRNELQDSGVSVTVLMPGATETHFFERAGLLDTKLGQSKKDDPAMVAKVGFEAMMAGESDVIAGWKSKIEVMASNVLPAEALAQVHRKRAEPGSGAR
jgi:uncharacterized protein